MDAQINYFTIPEWAHKSFGRDEIAVMYIGDENGYNIYVEQPNKDFKFVDYYEKAVLGKEMTDEIFKEFGTAIVLSELGFLATYTGWTSCPSN